MKKKTKIITISLVIVFAVIVCAALILKKIIPPGEEWIAYQNKELTASIDQQIGHLNMEQIAADKEKYIVEKNVNEMQEAVERGDLTYEEITSLYLYRIKTMDQNRHGLNSVVTIASDAVQQARDRDKERLARLSSGGISEISPLFGIPVMLKDNINTSDMPTSAGAEAFSEFMPETDAELVSILRKEGAVILGKNNLSEFAYFVSSVMPSGYSGAKGQTVNPFGPIKISPSGSSSGSAVAVTANLVPVSIGTETAGSIIGPSAVNSVVGFKPSRGWVSNEGIFPLISKVDTAGPIAKTVKDVIIAYNAIKGETVSVTPDIADLKGVVIGFAAYDYVDEEVQQNLRMELEKQGARLVDVKLDESEVSVQNIISLSFKQDFEAYAKSYGLPIQKLSDLLEYNKADKKRRMRYGQDLLEESDAVEKPDMDAIDKSIKNSRMVLDAVFEEQDLDAIVFLNSKGSTIAAAAGYPELTIPFKATKKGIPQGATFLAREGEEEKLLHIGYAFEQKEQGRLIP